MQHAFEFVSLTYTAKQREKTSEVLMTALATKRVDISFSILIQNHSSNPVIEYRDCFRVVKGLSNPRSEAYLK